MNPDNTRAKPQESPVDGTPPSGGLVRLLVTHALVIAVTCLLAGWWWGVPTAWVGLLSGGVCLLAAGAAHYLGIYPRGEVFLLTRLYQSAAVRIGLPVLYLFLCKSALPDLFAQGMVYFVILFYLVGLLTDLTVQFRRLKHLRNAANPALGNPARGNSQAG